MSDTSAPAKVRYSIAVPDPQSHLVEVTLTIDGVDELEADVLTVKMATWCPGSYLVRDYSRFVRDVRAANADGSPLAVKKSAKHAWEIATPHARRVTINYEVYGYDLSVRTNHINGSHAFLHPPATFLYVAELADQPHEVRIAPPAAREWTVATGLEHGAAPSTYHAADLDTLLDCPIHLGETEVRTFEAAGVPFELVVWGERAPGIYDLDDLVADLIPIVEGHARRFDGVPFDRYTFILMLAPKAYGGLEHKSSSANLASTYAFTKDSTYWELLELLSHEFFHVWNGKRIAPAAFVPFDYERENYTRCLWVVEGLTSYYDRYTLLQNGPLTLRRYLEKLAEEWSRLTNTPGRHRHSLESSSFDAWIKLYKPDPSNLNTTVSYYLKGGLVATTLDLWIRRNSDGERSLDDVLTALWDRFGKVGRGYPENIEGIVAEATGLDVSDPFARWITGIEDPDLVGELSHVGLMLGAGGDASAESVYLGIHAHDRPVRVGSVLDDSPAARVGVSPGDEIIALDGHRVSTTSELRQRMALRRPGDRVALAMFRRGLLTEVELELAPSPPRRTQISTISDADEQQKARFSSWLGAQWPSESLTVAHTSKRWT